MAALSSPPSPLPWGQLSLLFAIQLAEPITSTVIYPFIAQLVLELGLVESPAQTGYYAGLVESLFFLTEAVAVLHWGRLSDIVGRRPVLMGGLSGLAMSMLAFGLAAKPGHSRRFIALMLARALAGALNGNVGVSKSAMAELTDESNMARAFAFMPIIWSLGSSIGPFIGGGLAHPYERFPDSVFGRLTFFRDWPYFLPCATAATFSILVCIATAAWFRETAAPIDEDQPTHNGDPEALLIAPSTEATALLRPPPSPTSPSPSPTRSLRDIMTPRLRATVTAYALLALTDIGYLALQPLFMSSPVSAGGLGLEPSVIGWWMGSAGVINLPVQAVLFPRLHVRLGEKRVFVLGASAFLLLWFIWALTWVSAASLGDDWRSQDGAATVWLLLAGGFATYMGTQFCFAAIFIFVSHAAPRASLGAANGLAQTATSTMRAIGPAALTSLWAWSAGHLSASSALYSTIHAPSFVTSPHWKVGAVYVPLAACTVYGVMIAISIALIYAGTRLVEGRPESIYSGYGSQRQSRATLASTSSSREGSE